MWLYIWLAVIVGSLVLELSTMSLISVWFIGGAIIAMILEACGVYLSIQIVAFVIISLLLMLLCRKPLRKILDKDKTKTNTDSIIGKEFILITPIAFSEPGSVKVNDVVWTAVGESDDVSIEAKKIVQVVEIKGNKLIVKEKVL